MRIHLKPGQTIMEMLVVFFIISVGLYGAVTLIFSNVLLQEQDEDHIIAMNLAREALEITQNIRDSNWLANIDFDTGLGTDTGADCTAVPVWEGIAFPAFDFTADTIADGGINKNTAGMFTNQNGSSTSYSRLVTFAPICANPADRSDTQVPAGCACGGAPYIEQIGVRALTEVAWVRKGRNLNLRIYTDLYDWR
jgi:type II secretory pathway pseudopilin PulG